MLCSPSWSLPSLEAQRPLPPPLRPCRRPGPRGLREPRLLLDLGPRAPRLELCRPCRPCHCGECPVLSATCVPHLEGGAAAGEGCQGGVPGGSLQASWLGPWSPCSCLAVSISVPRVLFWVCPPPPPGIVASLCLSLSLSLSALPGAHVRLWVQMSGTMFLLAARAPCASGQREAKKTSAL